MDLAASYIPDLSYDRKAIPDPEDTERDAQMILDEMANGKRPVSMIGGVLAQTQRSTVYDVAHGKFGRLLSVVLISDTQSPQGQKLVFRAKFENKILGVYLDRSAGKYSGLMLDE
jgi:hypothetical protein